MKIIYRYSVPSFFQEKFDLNKAIKIIDFFKQEDFNTFLQ